MTDASMPTVLCLSSQVFNSDIEVLMEFGKRFQWAIINDQFLINAQRDWIPTRAQTQALYANESGPDIDEGWRKAKEYGLRFLRDMQARCNLVAVLAGNWDYWQDEGLRLACRELDIPFLVLHRELQISEFDRTVRDGFYADCSLKPNITAVAMGGQCNIDLFLDCKVFTKDNMRLTGWPRYDRWELMPTKPLYDRPIVLMAYMQGYYSGNHFAEMLQVFSATAERYPHIPFVVKAKHSGEYPQIRAELDKMGSRCELTDTIVMPALIKNARAVIGFNSMAVYEALLTEARILVPQWGDAAADPRYQAPSPRDVAMLPHMHFLDSLDDFQRLIDTIASAWLPPVDRAARINAFSSVVHYSTRQTATRRVEDFIAEFARKT